MSRIISFAKTVDAFLNREKTVTRRDWKTSYYTNWSAGDSFQAYSKSPRNDGEKVGEGKVVTMRKGRVDLLKRDKTYGKKEADLEGFERSEQGLYRLIEALKESGVSMDDEIYRIRFEITEVLD